MNPKSHRDRATWATFWLVLGAGIVWKWPGLMAYPYAVPVLAGAGGVALLYFVVGVGKATAEPDPMGRFWPFLFACGAAFLMGEGYYLPREFHFCNAVLLALYAAVLAAAGVRFLLACRPMPGSELPDPASLGMQSNGPASQQAAHAALSRNHPGWTPPKFRT
jgi:hypothetical protein